MDPVGKALWFIESHFAQDITLEEIAAVSGVSRFHISRAFGLSMGCTISGYIRGRRLTEAARVLAEGAPEILGVAIDAGYGSHEAFTRAFRDQFGLTPEMVRAGRSLDKLKLREAITMDQTMLVELEAPRFEDGRPILIAGLSVRYDGASSSAIPAQWQRFAPYLATMPGRVDRRVAYGLCYNSDEAGYFDYMCGVEVRESNALPDGMTSFLVPAQRYAVFNHRDHISTIRRTWNTIINRWVPESGIAIAGAPDFELYDERFDPVSGTGGLEIWIPVRAI
jgi:AraC family transcriptional regulator